MPLPFATKPEAALQFARWPDDPIRSTDFLTKAFAVTIAQEDAPAEQRRSENPGNYQTNGHHGGQRVAHTL